MLRCVIRGRQRCLVEERRVLRGQRVDLQAHARVLIIDEPAYLRDEGGANSKRLRTRFNLRENAQRCPLPPTHALLYFINEAGMRLEDEKMQPKYEEAIFEYFREEYVPALDTEQEGPGSSSGGPEDLVRDIF